MTSVSWIKDKVRFIDQSRLPAEEVYVETSDYRRLGEAIRRLEIRGAPAIGVAAAFGVILAFDAAIPNAGAADEQQFDAAISFLSHTRPTAVNLFRSLDRMRLTYRRLKGSDPSLIRTALVEEALAVQREDGEACTRIGENGATLISPGSTLLTHCNTGALATAGDGTAQSIITTAASQGKVVRVYVDETRPLLQGARLTAWELMRRGIEAVLITDSTAGFLMQQRKIDAVLVGADRIAANGDVANKIGTYALAVLAWYHGVPFHVAAPLSTIDHGAASWRDIPVEERDPREVTHIAGVPVAAPGAQVYAPAFDITPGSLITTIVTDAGILKPPFDEALAGVKSTVDGTHGGL
jgi:methylthioribose-1-phosphate isomerase